MGMEESIRGLAGLSGCEGGAEAAHIPVSGTGQALAFPRQREREKMDSRFHGNDEKGGGNDEKRGGRE